MNKTIIVSIDHGNKNIKSVGKCEANNIVYATGYVKSNVMPITTENLLIYKDTYFSIGQGRFPVIQKKFEDDRMFILSLPAIANKMDEEGVNEADIILGVGLPIAVYGNQRDKFTNYFVRDGIHFNYNGKEYLANIKKCFCFTQGYAAFLTQYNSFKQIGEVNVIDIGGYTTDEFLAKYGKLDIGSAMSFQNGVIKMLRACSQEVLRKGIDIEENQIEDVLMGRSPIFFDDAIVAIIEQTARDYTDNLISEIQESMELKANPTIFIGGGAGLIRKYIEQNPIVTYSEFIDIYGNSLGYQLLTEQIVAKGR